MIWHPGPVTGRLSRYALDGPSVLAWERCEATGREAGLYRYTFRDERAARAVVGRMLADLWPGGVLLVLARMAGAGAERLA